MSQIKNILILSIQVPFTRGGAEVLIDRLKDELLAREFNVDVISMPFYAEPKSGLLEQMERWRMLDLSAPSAHKPDLVIATKFPSYLVQHPNKVLWLIHQHRQAYELYGTRFGDFDTSDEHEAVRRMIQTADQKSLSEAKNIFTISENVSERLKKYLDFDSEVLNPPLPLAGRYQNAEAKPYILSVGRICSIKRTDLIIKAMAQIDDGLTLKLVGKPDEPAIEEYLNSEIEKHHLWHKIEFLGRVDDNHLLSLYADAFAVYYAPFDEDFGFVSGEALQSGKPVVTAHDSGGVLSYIKDRENGLVVEPNEKSIAEAFNLLYQDTKLYKSLTESCIESYSDSTWDEIIKKLTAT